MDSRNVNFSIKKSQIHTHMLGLTQKLTKLDIVLKGQVLHGILGLVPKNWLWISFCLPWTTELLWRPAEIVRKQLKNAKKCRKRQNSGNTSMEVAETPAGNQQRAWQRGTVHGPPFYVAASDGMNI